VRQNCKAVLPHNRFLSDKVDKNANCTSGWLYDDKSTAESDYKSLLELHLETEMSDVFDAALIKKTDLDNVLILRKYESPTIKDGAIGAGVGLVAGLIATLFPELAVTEAMVGEAAAASGVVGAIAGHVEKGMSNSDLRSIGDSLNEKEYAIVVSAETDVGDRIEAALNSSEQFIQQQLDADIDQINKDIHSALNS